MGVEIDVNHLPEGFDAYCICTGTPTARDLSIPGRELKGIHFALEMLAQQNRILAGQTFPKDKLVNAKGKKVLVIGGGDREPSVSLKSKSCRNLLSATIRLLLGHNGRQSSKRLPAMKKVVHAAGAWLPISSSERMEK